MREQETFVRRDLWSPSPSLLLKTGVTSQVDCIITTQCYQTTAKVEQLYLWEPLSLKCLGIVLCFWDGIGELLFLYN